MSNHRAEIKTSDMAEGMQQHAVRCATQAFDKYNIEKVNDCCVHLQLMYNPVLPSQYCIFRMLEYHNTRHVAASLQLYRKLIS